MILATLYIFLPAVAYSAALVNRTVDDLYGDSITGLIPTYLPSSDVWKEGSTCTTCNIYPAYLGHYPTTSGGGVAVDLSQVFNGTWHAALFHPGQQSPAVIVHFSGQAVYVFHTIANVVPKTLTVAHLEFTLDNAIVGYYDHTPDPAAPQLLYQVPVYVNESLRDGNHTLIVSAQNTSESSDMMFDYIIYTAVDASVTDPSAPASPSIQTVSTEVSPSIQTVSTVLPPSTGHRLSTTYIGITAASSILGTGIIAIAVTCFFRRRKGRMHSRSSDGDNSGSDSSSSSGPSTIAQLSNNIRASRVPSEAPWQSPRSSEGFSRAAARPESSSPSTPPTLATSSAGVALFAKLSTTTRSHDSPPAHSAVASSCQSPGPQDSSCQSSGPQDASYQSPGPQGFHAEPGNPARDALRAEVAALREEVAWLSGDRDSEVPPPYRPSP
ncbi:hypothetical protein VTO73DRAFT_220 [Trametes versicolor]